MTDETEKKPLRGMSEWQPIETAPEGIILVYGKWDGPRQPKPYESDYHVAWRDSNGDSGFLVDVTEDGEFIDTGFTPTHWMPLPDPPDGPRG